MKTLIKLWGFGVLAFFMLLASPKQSSAQYGGRISLQTFYDELSPYGIWVDDPDFGTVWVPDVQDDFSPYGTNGHWVYTDYGNTWVSDYDWGWATFHYGRWRYDDYYGWEWIPDYEWGPAWVTWRYGGGFYGWAPLGPGISIDMSFGSRYNTVASFWHFAPYAYINSPRISSYYVPSSRLVSVINRTTIINNTYVNGGNRYVTGPRAADIQRYTHQPVNVYHVNNAPRPGTAQVQNNAVNIYRPAIQRTADARPTRVIDAEAYRSAHPDQKIAGQNVGRLNHNNTARLATFARTAPADNKMLHVNDRPNGRNRGADAVITPANPANNPNNSRPDIPRTDQHPNPATPPGQPQMNDRQGRQYDQQRRQYGQRQQQGQPVQQQAQPPIQPQQQQVDQQRQQQQTDQQRQQQEQQRQQQRRQDDQQRRQRPPVNQVQQQGPPQTQPQQDQLRQQQAQQAARQQQEQQQAAQQQQARQQQEQARQQQEQQSRQQQMQQRQQDDQQRRQRPPVDQQQAQQQEQARQQQMQQAQQQARQQQDQIRQQQQRAQQEQARQAQQQQAQQQQQARQQQQQQQQDQQRQQQQQRHQDDQQHRQQREDQKKTPPPTVG